MFTLSISRLEFVVGGLNGLVYLSPISRSPLRDSSLAKTAENHMTLCQGRARQTLLTVLTNNVGRFLVDLLYLFWL